MDLFFLATADSAGRPNCSCKGADPGFVRFIEELTRLFTNFGADGSRFLRPIPEPANALCAPPSRRAANRGTLDVQGAINAERLNNMNATKTAGIVLVIAGIVSLAYGSFSYTKDTHQATIGPIELAVKDRETVLIPIWASVIAIVVGGALALGVLGKR